MDNTFPFELYDPKTMEEYSAWSLINKYMDGFQPQDQILARQFVDRWGHKYTHEILTEGTGLREDE